MTSTTLLLAAAMMVPGQNPFAGDATPPAAESKFMQEDMETMRLIIARKLSPVAVQAGAGHSYAWAPSDISATGSTAPADVANPAGAGQAASNRYLRLGSYYAAAQSHFAPASIESLYLPRSGVVFTMTLPPGKGDPRAKKTVTVKGEPLTDWALARSTLDGKAAPVTPPAPRRDPPLADVLLKVLADNAKHFRELRDEERITIAVTFRKYGPEAAALASPMAMGGDAVDTVTAGKWLRALNYHDVNSSPGQAVGASGTMPAGTAGGGGAAPDYDAVADLHMKRGNYLDAIKFYAAALDKNQTDINALKADDGDDASQTAAVQRIRARFAKLTQAQVAAGQFDAAKATMEAARNVGTKSRLDPSAPAAPPLPARLTISATKRDLVAAAASNDPLEALAKTAAVMYSEAGAVK